MNEAEMQSAALRRAQAGALGDVRVEIADWETAAPLVMPVRMTVFVEEQGVPEEIERFMVRSLKIVSRLNVVRTSPEKILRKLAFSFS